MLQIDDPEACVQAAAWSYDPDSLNVNRLQTFQHVAMTSFELPIPSDLLYLVARGNKFIANGSVELTDSGTINSGGVQVNILAFYNDIEDLQELVKVCLLRPEEGKTGVGIFASKPPSDPEGHQMKFELGVKLPLPSDGSGLVIKGFSTDLPHFEHQVGNLKDKVLFNSITLSSSEADLHITSLAGDNVDVSTSQGVVAGFVQTSTALDLSTSGRDIYVDVALLNGDDGHDTKLIMATSQGEIISNISLTSISETATGGTFEVDLTTSHKQLQITYPDAPLDHVLKMSAATSNAPVSVTLHKTFEGKFDLSSSKSTPTVHSDPGAEDPAGHGRHQDVEKSGTYDVSGSVQWLPSERTRELGSVSISTSKETVDLYV
ncbi:hypothetical protein AcW1_003331 [Taiwanofungus camphoratus]|nr:hypothetical protein AcW1_003331 [Antrodia cinnamomea]KAI0944065.1 hypothetical protein AcV7_001985 [Antrodia cinnamomea]